MRIDELTPQNKRRSRRRSGRGISAGRGKTAGRGTKGQKARTGGNIRPGFEGGQNPLIARIPKLPGFASRRPAAQTVTLTQLNRAKGKTVTHQTLAEAGIVSDQYLPIRIVASGVLSGPKNVQVNGASRAAIVTIEKAGGSFKAVNTPRRPSKKSADTDKKQK
jgi:large subunit ribosomal protein L15